MLVKTLKIALIALSICASNPLYSQTKKEVTRDWTSFTQGVTVKSKKKVKFKLQASIKVDRTDGLAGIWARVDNTNGETGFFDNMLDRPAISNEWKTYIIEGEIDKIAKEIYFGGICANNGKFYFDNFELSIENEKGELEKVNITNNKFEDQVKDQIIPGWNNGINQKHTVFVKGYTSSTITNTKDGSLCLMIEGKGIKNSDVINSEEGFTPQIGALVQC